MSMLIKNSWGDSIPAVLAGGGAACALRLVGSMHRSSAREKILIEHKLAGTNLLRRIVGFFEEVERRFGTAVGKATLEEGMVCIETGVLRRE